MLSVMQFSHIPKPGDNTKTRSLLPMLILALGILVSSSGCLGNLIPPDKSFVTGIPCSPPCWYGLELDKSGREDLYQVLIQRDFVAQVLKAESEATWRRQSAIEIRWGCLNPPAITCGNAMFVQDRLKLLTYVVGFTLTLEDVIAQLGTPSYVESNILSAHGGSRVALVYPDKSIILEHTDQNSIALLQKVRKGGALPRGLTIQRILFVTAEAFSASSVCCERTPWPGFDR